MCYFHTLVEKGGHNCVALFNHKHNIGFILKFENKQLDKFIQWKNLSKGQYVMGLEPSTNYIGGKMEEKAAGRIKMIPPMTSIRQKIEIEFLDNINEIYTAIS